MSVGNQVLAEFGHSMGMGDLTWPDSGVVVLEFESRGELYLEDRDDALLVYLVRNIDTRGGTLNLLKNALQLCHYRQVLPYVVQVGLRGESSLVFLIRLPANEANLPELERVLDTLTNLHDRVRVE
ncbi:MAG: hypothetical protein HC808_08285 [Candidatus Competibacteraceae bacterium]|nr:hypothetical protein [Candidatus Competibacteraceae bacterium]